MNSPITTRYKPTRTRLRASIIAVVASSMAIATFGFAGAASAKAKPKPTITVWVDSTRVPQVKAYEKAHPTVKISMVIYNGNANGSGVLQSKIALDNRVKGGWPDIVFSEENNDAASLASSQFNFPAVLNKGVVSKKILSGYASGTLAGCTVNGKVYCLRNDLAQDMLFYNSALMTQFGYTVPTTWQGWQTLGEQVAAQHPGYIVGSVGDNWDDDIYLWPSQCHVDDVVKADTIDINANDPNCTRATQLIDPLIKDGAVTTDSVFSSTFTTAYSNKILMMVGPSWYGQYLFPGIVAKGDLAVANPLSWGSGPTYTGEVGGGLWFMSSHVTGATKTIAASVLTWLSTSYGSQGISPGYPAYVADETKWIAAQQASGLYSNQIAPVFAKAATEVWPGWSPVPWSTDSVFGSTVVTGLNSGSTMTSQLASFAAQLTNYAQSDGYTVVTKP
jgi:ABC-type glycerol-3-phosphate transport system substrate-binding protein